MNAGGHRRSSSCTILCDGNCDMWCATLLQPVATSLRSFMHRRVLLLAASALAFALLWPVAPLAAAPASDPLPGTGFAFFPETGHNVGLQIKRFYDAQGGLAIF